MNLFYDVHKSVNPCYSLFVMNCKTSFDNLIIMSLSLFFLFHLSSNRYFISQIKVLVYICLSCDRCGMVYLDPDELKWMPYVKTWLKTWEDKMKAETFDYILDLFSKYVEDGLKFVNKKCEQAIFQVSVIVSLYILILYPFACLIWICVYVCEKVRES